MSPPGYQALVKKGSWSKMRGKERPGMRKAGKSKREKNLTVENISRLAETLKST